MLLQKVVVDVRDIERVIDEASNLSWKIQGNNSMKENELEEILLLHRICYENSLNKMDIDVPVVKRNRDSKLLLIAKANDKLGIIEEAKEAIKNKDEKEEV